MSEPKQPPKEDSALAGSSPRRIETQIHRRKKAKAVLPLEAEWDQGVEGPPVSLRMPPDKMKKGK
ncbi:MAG: hypothetical protein EPO64_00885 [Nitrospirae bacterium]|nr:MAG: hypothetical protein EPO64_00885 [Nitrospirota bacterium]